MEAEETNPPQAATQPQARPLGTPAGHPLGPLVRRIPARRPARAKAQAAAVLLACLGLLSVALCLKPNPAGLGTHRQLGFPACNMVVMAGIPCPTCGMTTAFAYTVRGNLPAAFHAQPAGCLLALATIVSLFLSLTVLATGKVWLMNWYRVSPRWVVASVVAVILIGWGYKLGVGFATGALPVH